MSTAGVLAIVFFLFFLVGVAVGVLVVIATSARRAHKAAPQVWPVTPPSDTSGHDPDEGGPDEPAWWHARGGD